MFSTVVGAYKHLKRAVTSISNTPVLSSCDFLSLEVLNILIHFLLYGNYSLSKMLLRECPQMTYYLSPCRVHSVNLLPCCRSNDLSGQSWPEAHISLPSRCGCRPITFWLHMWEQRPQPNRVPSPGRNSTVLGVHERTVPTHV